MGNRGVKDEKISWKHIAVAGGIGILLFYGNGWLLGMNVATTLRAALYTATLLAGFLGMLAAGLWSSRLLKNRMADDPFNADNENIFGGSSKSAEEKTAKNITDFVKKLDSGFPASGSGHTTLTCTDFKNQTEVYAFVCREIISVSDSEAKSWFFTIKAFNSEYVHVVYETERVKDGFASLNIVFKKEKNQPKYYVVFSSPNN